jgi:hypothetical protein
MLKPARLLLLSGLTVVAVTGCRGCLRENLVYEHTFNRPDCGRKPCPVECPEFDLPPGGPYVVGPGAGAGMAYRNSLEK